MPSYEENVAHSPNTWDEIAEALPPERWRLQKAIVKAVKAHRNSPAADDYMPLKVNPFDRNAIDETVDKLNAAVGDCTLCEGYGWVQEDNETFSASNESKCPRCDGAGKEPVK